MFEAISIVRWILLIGFILTSQPNHGQPQVSPMKIGEKFEYTFTNVINYPMHTANVNDFSGRLLILYFWSTGCSSCIESWPRLLSLQERFRDDIQIILVNAKQNDQVVRRVFKTREEYGVSMTLPTVCKDTVLDELFYYPGVPRVAWFDQAGYFRSFTDGSSITEDIIGKILNKNVLKMTQLPLLNKGEIPNVGSKRTKLRSANEPLFINGNGEESPYIRLVSQSILTGRIDGHMLLQEFRGDSIQSTLTLHGPIERMYTVAFNSDNFREDSRDHTLWELLDNRVVWENKHPKFSVRKPSGEGNEENWYCYQLTLATNRRHRFQEMLLRDLDRYFGLEANLEKRRVKALVLVAVDTLLAARDLKEDSPSKLRLRSFSSVARLVHYLSYATNYFKSPYPILDETNYKGVVRGLQPPDGNNYLRYNKELEKCGLRWSLEERVVEVLVVRQPVDYQFPEELEYFEKVGQIDWGYPDD